MKPCFNVDLTYDKDFKLFLKSSKRVCTRFLHDFIPDLKQSKAQVIGFRDPKILTQQDQLKSPILDVVAETNTKQFVNVELQKVMQKLFGARSVFYGSRLMNESLTEGLGYNQIYQTYVLGLVDFTMFPLRKHYYTRFALICTDDIKLVLSECLQFVFVEMGKFIRVYKNRDLASFIDQLDNRALWIYIIKTTPYLTAEHRKLIAARDPVMEEAMGILEQIDRAKGPERILAEAREKARRDDEARRDYVFEKGLTKGEQKGFAEGEQKGRQTGQLEERWAMARRMLKANKPLAEICEFTGLSKDEVHKL